MFVLNFPFLAGTPPPPGSTPLMAKIRYTWQKIFVDFP